MLAERLFVLLLVRLFVFVAVREPLLVLLPLTVRLAEGARLLVPLAL